jgi:hypothetical protein
MGAEAAMAAPGVERLSAVGNGPWAGGRANGDNLKTTIFLFFSFWSLQLKFKWGKIDVLV